MPFFGMRYGVNQDSQLSGNEDLSLYYGLGFGFRKDNLSLESGLSFFFTMIQVHYILKFMEDFWMFQGLGQQIWFYLSHFGMIFLPGLNKTSELGHF